MRVLLLTPPMTQLNTPYPATACLTGFLRGRGYDAVQADPSIELVLRLFSRAGIGRIRDEIGRTPRRKASQATAFFLANFARYEEVIESAIRFLQGKDPSLALRIVGREFLPEGPRFNMLGQLGFESEDEGLSWAFGALGVQDRAKFLASLFVDDLADVVRESIDHRFGLSRYAEALAASEPSFNPIVGALGAKPTLLDRMLDEITEEIVARHRPDVVGLSAPFPGNVYGAFRVAKLVRKLAPRAKLVLGGGYVNTELRELSDPRVFDYFDYVMLDSGEFPLLCLLERLKRGDGPLVRTFVRQKGKVVFENDQNLKDVPHGEVGTPTYDGLPLDCYLSIFEMPNPMHRIWSDGRWNKLTLAHGCYWHKCSFCDTSLDYIGRYDAASADLLVDRIESLVRETGQSGFHFTDEAAPPALLRALAKRLIERGVAITWWGNIRFEKMFTPDLARLLARSGCVAVSGGLEAASDRLLKLMGKGVTVEQVARVTCAFTDAGIMVHAYLMYGFPTQTEQETIDALDRVRQLFEAGCIQSAYWHRFSATVHSPVGREPEKYGIKIRATRARRQDELFARNDLVFDDPTGCDHALLSDGLKKAVYNYMLGAGLELDVRKWFDHKVPKPKVPRDLIARAIDSP